MKFVISSELKAALREPTQRLAHLPSLLNAVTAIGPRNLTHDDCKMVQPLYAAAAAEVERVRRHVRNARTPIRTDGAAEFLGGVYVHFVHPLAEMQRYLFVPFEVADELDEWAQAWVQAYAPRKAFEYHKFSPYKQPFRGIPLLSQIYVLGHGSAGSKTLSTSEGSGGMRLSHDTLAFRMKKAGLDPQFWGKVKVYACSGGQEGPEAAKSFTEQFAGVMRTSYQYTNCEYFGYSADLRSPKTFEAAGGKFTHTTADSAGSDLVTRLKAKFGADLARFHALPKPAQDLEVKQITAACIRERYQTTESRASEVRRQF